MGATDRSQMKESYKWNRVLLFRRIELLSARAREPALVSIEKTLGESLGFQSLPFFIFGQWLWTSFRRKKNKKYACNIERTPRDFGK
jgi:hypothetical protein